MTLRALCPDCGRRVAVTIPTAANDFVYRRHKTSDGERCDNSRMSVDEPIEGEHTDG